MIRATKCLLLGLSLAFATSASARAELIITVGNTVFNPGGTGIVDVTIASSDGSPLAIDGFAFMFQIQPTGGTQTQLAFAEAQPQPYGMANYVFAANSLNDSDPSNPDDMGFVSRSITKDDTYIGGDSSGDGTPRSVVGGKLLLQLTVTAATDAPPMVGDSFAITLVAPDASTGGNASSPTYFTNGGGTNFLPFTSAGGIVMIQIIPEPASIVLFGLGLSAALVPAWRRRHRRTSGA